MLRFFCKKILKYLEICVIIIIAMYIRYEREKK